MSFRTKNVSGPDAIEADFVRLGMKYPKLALRAFEEVIDRKIGPETQEEVPVETGALARSWSENEGANFIIERTIRTGYVGRTFGYGMNYAFWVHEIPPPEVGSARPKQLLRGKSKGAPKSKISGTRTARHRPPTKWKYLEEPAMRHYKDPPKLLLQLVEQLLTGEGE